MKHRRAIACVLAGVLAWSVAASPLAAADWPMYRGDAGRSACAAEPLPAKLKLLWRYESRNRPEPAWRGMDTRMTFDWAYQPVVAGGRLFFGSSADGKVYALDAATGVEQWTFFTGAPIRFAPAAWKDRLFVASDDGYLYCLAASDGRVLWKRRGGPSDSSVLGNGRIISRWPARGGPAVADGVVYFAAGIWPSEGIYVYALDAATGRRLWCNDRCGTLDMGQPHGGAQARSGISAQGYLVVAGDRLLVPTGRAVPAVFRRRDGKFLYFRLRANGTMSGGGEVLAGGSMFFTSGGYRGTAFHLSNGARIPTGIRVTGAAAGLKTTILASRGKALAFDTRKMWIRKSVRDRKGRKTTRLALAKPLWKRKTPTDLTAMVLAGDAVVFGAPGKILAVDLKTRKTRFETEISGRPYALAVADGRLYASTDAGTVYCFGAGASGQPRIVKPAAPALLADAEGPYVAAAEEILRRSNIREGYCVDLACGDGSLAHALATRSKLHIYALAADATQVARLRRKFDTAGRYGTRVTVHLASKARTHYPKYFANLIVSGESVAGSSSGGAVARDHRMLRPCGGVAMTGRAGAMTRTIRGPLPRAGRWTHQYADPANTNCSADELRGPLRMLWFTDPALHMPSRHGRGPAPLFLDGRLFVQGVNAVRCVDAYNGRRLWEYPLPGIGKDYDAEHLVGLAATGGNYCVTADGVYVRTGAECLRLDPATGKLTRRFAAPPSPGAGKPGAWGLVARVGDTLFGSVLNTKHRLQWQHRNVDMSKMLSESALLFAMDVRTGNVKWKYTPKHSIRNNAIAFGSGNVFLIDRPLALRDRPAYRTDGEGRNKVPPKDKIPAHPTGTLVVLDAETGISRWQTDDNIYGTVLSYSQAHNILVMSYLPTRFRQPSEVGGRMAGFRIRDGKWKRIWDKKAGFRNAHPILNGRTIYAQPSAWDLLTGRKKPFAFQRSYGCGIASGSKHLMLFRSAVLGYLDVARPGRTENYGGIRPGCWINAIPAGGLVLMPDATERCICSYLIKASIALEPARP